MNEHVDVLSTEATNTVACNEEATNEVVEEWRPVVGYEGLYEVSSLGRVCSLHGRKGRQRYIMKQKLTRYGYYEVQLSKDGIQRSILVHILVARAFIPNPENKDQIDHINAIRTDNRVENLRWATSHENHINPITVENYRKKFSSQAYRNRKREDYYKSGAQDALEAANEERKRPVYCIELNKLFPSLREAERKTGCFAVNIKVTCERYLAGRKTVAIKNGKRVLHWRWPTPEEVAAYNEQQNQTQAE